MVEQPLIKLQARVRGGQLRAIPRHIFIRSRMFITRVTGKQLTDVEMSEVRKVQSLNDDLPIDVSDEGRPIETKASQPSKAESPMEVVPSGTVAWPFASGVNRQPAVTPPMASRTKVASLMRRLTRGGTSGLDAASPLAPRCEAKHSS